MVGAERAKMSQALPAGTLGFVVSERRYAGFWKRFAAYLIDFILLYIVEGVLAVGVVMMSPREINVVGILYGVINFQLVSAALAWAYFALFESSPMQGTVGKYALGIYVTDRHGDPIGFWRATARYWLKILSSLTLMVGGSWPPSHPASRRFMTCWPARWCSVARSGLCRPRTRQ